MNILVNELPETISIHGVDYRIRTDFKVCLLTILAFEDNELVMNEKQGIMVSNLFIDVPEDIDEAVTQSILFLNGGKPIKDETEDRLRLYSFSKDAPLIFAAFKQTHGIDLETAQLHWWKFLALFMDLGSETLFCSLVGLRERVKTGKATPEERRIANRMGDMFDLPELDTRTTAEKERERLFFQLAGQKG